MVVFGLGKLLKRPCIAIDLGTANVGIYVTGRGIVVDAPSVIESASEKEATGTGWQQMEHKGVEMHRISPLRDGVIVDVGTAFPGVFRIPLKAKGIDCATGCETTVSIGKTKESGCYRFYK
ncbi:MAG TPA: rod shape-determining protein [Thermodesulfobacteriota bacterium]|nr:rod shape-determining protein [Thermodesulfobacteriota bacterium]